MWTYNYLHLSAVSLRMHEFAHSRLSNSVVSIARVLEWLN